MTLYVKPISALLTHDTEMFSNMDPYVIVKVGNQKIRTRTHQEGGKKPRWDEVITIKTNNPTKMEIIVMDEDTVTDDVVGSAVVDLKKYAQSCTQQKQYVSLTYKNRSAGKIYLSIRYEPVGFNQGNNNPGGQYGSSWGSQPSVPYQQPAFNSWGPPQPSDSGWGSQQPNNGWVSQPNNSGWGEQMPPPMPSNNPYNQPPPPAQEGNIMGLLGNVLQQNANQPAQNQQNSNWGQNNNNNGWGPNNNGWGNNPSNNNSGWGNGW